ncbi:hypothetical protein BDK51DRAFT_32615 [Blyttiomyces helicus]|uniref:Uncharacterized protein n=1 Tax=Blyttiomyces helicus TaxID=388810 RepID=A0A4P9WQ08_9FUNG|nr:hypothetical protein BDK51DRAFT_32615 [Blyttiomyces helicus]|eukprot:RKO92926.1 hypothetical protein BDK51DRAFT_32615 [Blyttiomyces helicus]
MCGILKNPFGKREAPSKGDRYRGRASRNTLEPGLRAGAVLASSEWFAIRQPRNTNQKVEGHPRKKQKTNTDWRVGADHYRECLALASASQPSLETEGYWCPHGYTAVFLRQYIAPIPADGLAFIANIFKDTSQPLQLRMHSGFALGLWRSRAGTRARRRRTSGRGLPPQQDDYTNGTEGSTGAMIDDLLYELRRDLAVIEGRPVGESVRPGPSDVVISFMEPFHVFFTASAPYFPADMKRLKDSMTLSFAAPPTCLGSYAARAGRRHRRMD